MLSKVPLVWELSYLFIICSCLVILLIWLQKLSYPQLSLMLCRYHWPSGLTKQIRATRFCFAKFILSSFDMHKYYWCGIKEMVSYVRKPLLKKYLTEAQLMVMKRELDEVEEVSQGSIHLVLLVWLSQTFTWFWMERCDSLYQKHFPFYTGKSTHNFL